ncbi:MAG: hypothetical protein IKO35_03100, partial [Elusimicrobiaceae bacterium]|nr:hypothetical protein [Elusimicrobiaceae bacterium]
VVLIIGILVSVAMPMYQGAIDKSRWARMLAPSRAIANAQESAYMKDGGYTVDKSDLIVSYPSGGDISYTLHTVDNGDDANCVRISTDKLNNVRLARHYKHDDMSEQLFCEAKSNDDRANTLCNKRLKGSRIGTTDDGYVSYILSDFDLSTSSGCQNMNWVWSNAQNTCYPNAGARCTGNVWHGIR